MRLDPLTSSDKTINIYCGTEKGVRHFSVNVETRMIDENSVPNELKQLKNVYDI